MNDKIVIEVHRQTPSAHLKFKGSVLMQMWEVEFVNKHYSQWELDPEPRPWHYDYSSYTTSEEWRTVEGQIGENNPSS